ncbi:hypothetical protein L7F22_035523 [Adiantum nelumboides]|nr:hypothetical protein [Adiantum nelumboides]
MTVKWLLYWQPGSASQVPGNILQEVMKSIESLNATRGSRWEAKAAQYRPILRDCCQKKRSADSDDKEDRKGKKPMASLVPYLVGDKHNLDASELCRAWGKVRDQTKLIFFDPGAMANFISPELASKLGIRPKEMGYTANAGMACSGHSESVTPIIGKLHLHIQSYVDAEKFYSMPLDGCDVLLGIP